MALLSPHAWLMLVLALATPATYGVMWLKREWAVSAAYKAGEKAGAATVAATVTAASGKRAEAFEEGWREPAPIPPERARIIELCAKSASCRDRRR